MRHLSFLSLIFLLFACDSVVEKSAELATFQKVVVMGPGTLKLSQGEQPQLTIETKRGVLKHLESEVRGSVLYLGPNQVLSDDVEIVYTLTVSDLESLSVVGSAHIIGNGVIESEKLRLSLKGPGRIEIMELHVEDLNATLAGLGTIEVAGNAKTTTVSLRGAGNYDGTNLLTDSTAVVISGSSHAWVHVSKMLDVKIAGSGRVIYTGDPEITQSITGTGKLKKGN